MHTLEDGECSLPEDDRLVFCYNRKLRSRCYKGLGVRVGDGCDGAIEVETAVG